MRDREPDRQTVLEYLRAIKLQADGLTADFAEVKARLDALIAGIGGLNKQGAGFGARLDRLDVCLARIEQRLQQRAR